MKKNFLSRMTRRKGSTPTEQEEEAFELPPPTAIDPNASVSSRKAEQSDYDSHQELELLASDEPTRADSANGFDAQESDAAPDLESMTAPDSGESLDRPESSSEAALFEEYDLDLELLTEPEPEQTQEVAEPDREDEERVPITAESTMDAAEPEILQKDAPEAAVDVVSEDEEGVSGIVEYAGEGALPEPETTMEREPEAVGDSAPEDEEAPAASVADEGRYAPEVTSNAVLYEEYDLDLELLKQPEPGDSPGEAGPLYERDETVPVVEETVVEADTPEPARDEDGSVSVVAEDDVEEAAVEPEIPEDSELEPAEEVAREAETPMEAAVSQESPNEFPEPVLVENGFSPLVRDARGDWRSGKGFSRSELREAGLTSAEAARLGVRIDKRRRNAHPMNVAALERAKSGV